MEPGKVHLMKKNGNRSACRYSSRPSRRVRVVSLQEFADTPEAQQCSECRAAYERFCAELNEATNSTPNAEFSGRPKAGPLE